MIKRLLLAIIAALALVNPVFAAQHDYDITTLDADSGVAMRSAINSALQSLASNNLGATAPAPPGSALYAGMWWVDSANDLVKMRSEDNLSWITKGSIAATWQTTPSQILTDIKTVDSTGSGLDADLLDGQSIAYYATSASPSFTGQLYVNRDNPTSYTDATIQAASSAGNVVIGLHAIGTSAASIRHLRGGSGLDVVDTSNSPAPLTCATAAAGTNTIQVATTAYVKSNFNGTVSGTYAAPTGAIIETGTNGNGRYTKFADGTMICTHSLTTADGLVTQTYGWWRTTGVTWTFPVAFASVPNVNTAVDSGTQFTVATQGAPTTTTVAAYALALSSDSATKTLRLTAIGKWM